MIAKIPLDWRKIILIGTVLAFGAYILRLFPIAFGLHTILQIVLLVIVLTLLGKAELSLSLIASLLSFLTLAIFEFICLSLLMPVFNVTPETLFADPIKRIVLGEPNVLLLFISAFLLNKYVHKRGSTNEFL